MQYGILRESARSLLECLPLETVTYAFAYGSSAISQQGENAQDKMVDFLITTKDSTRFHTENIRANPGHYSFVRWFGPATVTNLQTNYAAHVFYNTRVRTRGRQMKYGVISEDDLQTDLLDWCWLYASGRLHKPVLDVIPPSETLARCILDNRKCALDAALIQLPEQFTYDELFEKIVGISYSGDFRQSFGEDRNKITKIVRGGFEQLKFVYDPLLVKDRRIEILGDNSITQDGSTTAIYHRLNLLPQRVIEGLYKIHRKRDVRVRDIEEVLFLLAHRNDVGDYVAQSLAAIVKKSAFRQTVKNACSAGFNKSVVYAFDKLAKMFKSMK
ncbi:Protein Y71F9B.2 [Aphelenchoides avenae]|nr:Protein Y71F9B.2 [Aphelenchus avenae]